ncbi:MAG TPA: asparagine synthetase B [Verrucomicrobiae bacterium]|nr:asparagine synthetase B [Verrucomicrobiae bacterium]
MKVTLAVLDKHGDNVVDRVLEVLDAFSGRQPCHFGLVSPMKSVFEKSPGVLRRQGLNSSTLVGYVSSKPASSSGYEFLQLDDAALVFEGSVYSPIPEAAVMEQFAKKPLHCEAVMQKLIANADGDYSFLMLKNGWIGAGRDPVGVQPLYYGENQDVALLATNRRAIWKLGIENPVSFPPGNIAFVSRESFQFKPIKTLTFAEPTPITLDTAEKRLRVLLEESIRNRTHDVKKVAVAFSGGLDSSIVAYLASKLGVTVNLLHVSMENQAETEEAIEASNELNLPLQVNLFKESDVEKILPVAVALIEEPDPIKASIGLPFYWTAEKAAEAGFRVMLAGQGADELFGGYQRYVNEYCKEGSEKVRKTMFNDVVKIHESNLERDLKITVFHDVELRLPFASFELAEFAVSLPIECKMEQKSDTLRKLVLRKVALNAGMPSVLVDKPKKAVQYSTGINNAIKRIAKKQGKEVNEYITELLHESKR